MRKVKIKFHGFLGELIPEVIEGSFETLHDVFMYLSHNYPQLKAPLNIGRYAVKVEGYNTRESIYCPLTTDNIEVYPTTFSKSAGFGQIIIGVVLVIVGALVAAFVPGGQPAGIFLMKLGIAFIVSGVLTYLLTPEFKNKGDHKQGDNKYLGTPGNTTASGTPIPIGYGRFKVFGHFLSYNISSSSVVIGASKIEQNTI